MVLLPLAILLLPFIPARIASSKGHSGVGYYFFGLFFFLPALIVAIVIQPRPVLGAAVPSPAASTTPPVPSLPATPQASPGNGVEKDEPRRISYPLGAEVTAPASAAVVCVTGFEDAASWKAHDGGRVTPKIEGARFARIQVQFAGKFPEDDLGDLADYFGLELTDGRFSEPLSESYSENELQGRYGVPLTGGSATGLVYFELAPGDVPTGVLFDCIGLGSAENILLRWDLGAAPDHAE